MKKEERIDEENIPESPDVDSNHISVDDVPYQGTGFISDTIAVTYGPDPTFFDDADSIDDEAVIFMDDHNPVELEIDSNMYGGPVPVFFYNDDVVDMSEFISGIELLGCDEIESDNNDKEKKTP